MAEDAFTPPQSAYLDRERVYVYEQSSTFLGTLVAAEGEIPTVFTRVFARKLGEPSGAVFEVVLAMHPNNALSWGRILQSRGETPPMRGAMN